MGDGAQLGVEVDRRDGPGPARIENRVVDEVDVVCRTAALAPVVVARGAVKQVVHEGVLDDGVVAELQAVVRVVDVDPPGRVVAGLDTRGSGIQTVELDVLDHQVHDPAGDEDQAPAGPDPRALDGDVVGPHDDPS